MTLADRVDAAVRERNARELSNGEWQFQCPSGSKHKNDDAHPSACWNPTKQVFHCHACGESGGYVHLARLLGLNEAREPGRDDENGHRPPAKTKQSTGWRDVATYDYVDERGALVFQVMRQERIDPESGQRQKNFPCRRPDGHGGWVWSLKDIRRVLYRLPEILEAMAAGRTVHVCEGEKDADRLITLGLTATCNSGGAGKWQAEYNATLRDAHVVIFPDQDEPGLKHGNAVVKALMPVVRSLRVVHVPDAKDVSDYLDAGRTREELFALIERADRITADAPRSDDQGSSTRNNGTEQLPIITVGAYDLAEVSNAAWNAIHGANDPPFLFRFGGVAARIEHDDHGQPITRAMSESRWRHVLARIAIWQRETDKGPKPALPPVDVVRDMLAQPDLPLPPLYRIVSTPVFAQDGSISLKHGYQPASRTYYQPTPGLSIPPLSMAPSIDDVAEARRLIVDELLADFPFTSDSERAHAVALLLLPFIRELIDGSTPLFLIEKPTPATGASLLASVLMLPALGRAPAVMTEGRSEEEWRKRITAALMDGPAVVQIDNLRGRLDAAALAAALTSSTWMDRILGKSQVVTLPIRCVWLGTGNNPSLSNEIARRSIRIRLDAHVERPWERSSFRHELPAWAERERARLVWAALTLTQRWIAAGSPSTSTARLGSYEDWSRVSGGILAQAGIPGFLANRHELYEQSDGESASMRTLIAAWWERHEAAEVGVSDLWALVTNDKRPIDVELGRGGDRSQRTKLGKLLSQHRDRQYGPFHIRAAGKVKQAQQWRLEPVADWKGGEHG